MQFGLSMPIVQQLPGRAQAWELRAGGPELLVVAREAERLGFSHLSACDHVAIPRTAAPAAGTVWYDPAVTLSFVAAATTRIRLLSHVIVLPYRHPLVLAKAFATLDHLSDGRVIFGAGCGHLRPEFRSLGVNYTQRGRLSDESLQAIQRVWENETATFSGTFIRFHDVTIAPRPRQHPRPPIWVGGNSRAAVRRAARYADGWIPWLVTPARFAKGVQYARQLREQGGQQTPLQYVAPLSVGVDDRPGAIRARIETWVEAGATSFHVGFVHTSLDHLRERMALFADTVLRPAR
ncbi:MAG: TIGR03619 family F420-dependent LLM class oxidoreductase [Candidatus Binatia bacterium]